MCAIMVIEADVHQGSCCEISNMRTLVKDDKKV